VEFSGTNATLDVPHANILAFAAVAMAPSDTIDLSYVTYDSNGSVSVGPNNVIMLVENGTTHTINLSPSQDLTGEYFHIASDGFNGTDIIENSVPCFLAGTRIRTPAGDVPVEALNIGDLVTTAARTAKPIKWIGRRCYKAPLPPNPDIVPVCIAPGALADGLPDRDLFLSPLHALLIDDVLVPAGALVNGKSIRHCPELNQISYYHIETEAHDLVIANNAPAETFVDENSRNMFENAEEFYRLYPNAFHPTTVLAAPRLEFGAELERIRRKIALRAGVLLDQPRDGEVIGYLESADRRKITGWAYAPKQPNVPLCLDILNGGALLARTIANIPRPDVRQAGFGTGRYGFSVTLPAPLPALSRHEISIRPTGATRLLAGSPVVIDPGVASELLQTGGLQSLIDAAIRGAETPQQALQLGNTLEMAGKQIRVTTEADSGPAPARPAAAGRKVVLFLDEFWPTVTHDAGSNAVMSHIAAFQALGYQVVFCATSGAPRDGAAQAGCLALREHGVACHGQDGGAVETVLKDLARSGLDVVYLHRLGAAGAYAGMVKHIAPAAYVIYAIADIHALRLQRQAEVTDRPDLRLRAKSVEAAEFWAMQVVDCVLTHSRFEAAYLRHRVPHLNVKVVPWAVAPHPPGRLNARADIAFIGGAGHAPNVDAVAHLADSIMPLVWRELPEVRCLIAGAGWPAPRGGADDRMVYLGHQPDLAALLGRVKLTVAPLRFGAGIKGKVLESLAAGTPCVMSHIAAEGLPLTPLLQSVVGNGAELAANIRAVYRNKKTQRLLGTAGIDLIADHFSEQAVVAALSDALRRQAAPLRPVQVAAA
jgi:glycosyltransferase involved in cell wall biosynthesis